MGFITQTHCQKGHKFTPENCYTYLDKRGHKKRKCRECIRVNAKSQTSKDCKLRWAQRNPERSAANIKAWRDRNIDKSRASARKSAAKRRTERRDEWLQSKRRWTAENPDRIAIYDRRRICKKHGITEAKYLQIEDAQGGLCAICRQACTEKKGTLCVDHDHNCCSGKIGCGDCVRGLLCTKCNQAIGCFKENADILKKAIEYLILDRATREKIWQSGDRALKVVA